MDLQYFSLLVVSNFWKSGGPSATTLFYSNPSPCTAWSQSNAGKIWCKLSPPFVTDRSQPVIIKGVSGRVGSESATAAAGGEGGEEVDNTWCYTCRHSQPAPSSKSPLLHHSNSSFAPSNFKPGFFPFFLRKTKVPSNPLTGPLICSTESHTQVPSDLSL